MSIRVSPVPGGVSLMPFLHDPVSERLSRENDEYRRLLEKHRTFEEKLEKLNARHILSDEEKVEAITLKKHKLALKDRMAEMIRQHTEASPSRASH
jgi:uncharacterized protein